MVRGRYGELESNGWSREEHDEWLNANMPTVQLEDKRLKRIKRLRLLSDPGFPFWDVSYCYGLLDDGTKVRVQLPRHQFSKAKWRSELYDMCREAGVYGKGLGLFDAETVSRVM